MEKVCDRYGTVADPCAEQHEESNPGLHFTALQRTGEEKAIRIFFFWMESDIYKHLTS